MWPLTARQSTVRSIVVFDWILAPAAAARDRKALNLQHAHTAGMYPHHPPPMAMAPQSPHMLPHQPPPMAGHAVYMGT